MCSNEKIESQNPKYRQENAGKGGYQKGWEGRPKNTGIGFANKDGKEEAADWDCQPSCPVKLLDEQSGVLKTGDVNEYTRDLDNDIYNHGVHKKQNTSTHTGDEGGASRYFWQATTSDQLDHYLKKLTRQPLKDNNQ